MHSWSSRSNRLVARMALGVFGDLSARLGSGFALALLRSAQYFPDLVLTQGENTLMACYVLSGSAENQQWKSPAL